MGEYNKQINPYGPSGYTEGKMHPGFNPPSAPAAPKAWYESDAVAEGLGAVVPKLYDSLTYPTSTGKTVGWQEDLDATKRFNKDLDYYTDGSNITEDWWPKEKAKAIAAADDLYKNKQSITLDKYKEILANIETEDYKNSALTRGASMFEKQITHTIPKAQRDYITDMRTKSQYYGNTVVEYPALGRLLGGSQLNPGYVAASSLKDDVRERTLGKPKPWWKF